MKQSKQKIALILLIFSISLSACSPVNATAITEPDQYPFPVTVSLPPQKFFLERIGGQWVEVNVMVPPGGNPHSYEPTPQQMKELSQSRAYFSIGVDFENAWLVRFQSANPGMLMVNTIEDIQLVPLPAAPHDHDGDTGHEDENAIDNHIWTSPELVRQISNSIFAALVKIDPLHESDYKQNLDVFLNDIDLLQNEIHSTLPEGGKRSFLVFHPAWGYFAREFGLEQIPVEVGGQEPSPSELAAVIQQAKNEDIRVIFVQPSINPLTAQTIAREIGASVLVIDPLAEDWLENLRQVAQTFARVMDQ